MTPNRTVIKICGITDFATGCAAIDAGAEYLGFVFYPPSHRFLDGASAARLVAELRGARPEGWRAVGVFVNEPLEVVRQTLRECQLDVVQLNGEETPDYIRQVGAAVFKAIRVPAPENVMLRPQAEGSPARPEPHASGRSFAALRMTAAALPTAADLGAERILVDANVTGRYGGTGLAYDWSRVREAVKEGFLAGGLAPDNVLHALESAHPWGVDVSSGVEEDGVKRPDLIVRFIATVREFDG